MIKSFKFNRDMEEQIKKLERKRAKDITRREPKVDKKGLRVSILNPILLFIGQWKFEPINEEDELVVKGYFVQKQLVWEVLSNGCRKKIEIEWSNIIGIRATLKENEPGVLDVELSQPPKFYRELDNVDKRAHDKWVDGSDFTRGEASICRRHLVMFPPGMLNKDFERMISFDERLLKLSQKPYPTLNLTHFPNESSIHNAPQSNLSDIQPSSYQTLQLPQTLQFPHAGAFGPLPPTPVPLPSHPMMFGQTLGSSVTRNSNIINPQESPSWRSVPQLVSNSNGYLWNNNNYIGPSDCFNGVSNSNWPMNSYGISNHQPTYPHESFPNDYYSLVNWPTDPHGVWLPPPQ